MDAENFDTERLAACCDSNCYADGTQIPVCAYNVLYREKEERFMTEPRTWGSRESGRVFDAPITHKDDRRLRLPIAGQP
jgi:uncharacterized radical SAM superfamily Fe-S cluster-containing enzyme